MRKLIRGIRIVLCVLAAYVLVAAWQTALSQEPGPPPGGMGGPPSMNVDDQLSQMTKRYKLSDAQQAQIRPILADTKKKMDDLFQNSSLPPDEQFKSMRAIHDDEVTRISAVLNDDQRAKYQKDQKHMGPPGGDGMEGPPPGPPPQN
jgi:Spy/CpxP family protein refolding chaperone